MMNDETDSEEIEFDPFVKALASASQSVAASLGQLKNEQDSETREEASSESDNEDVIGGYYDSFKSKIETLSQRYKEEQEAKQEEKPETSEGEDTKEQPEVSSDEEKSEPNEEQSNEEGNTQEPSEEPVDDEKSDEEKPAEETKEESEAEKDDDKKKEDNFWKNHEQPHNSVHNVIRQFHEPFHERYIEVLEKRLGIIYEEASAYRELDEYKPFSITKKFYLGKEELGEVFEVDFYVSFLCGLYHELKSDPKFSEKHNSLLQNLKKKSEEALNRLNDQKHDNEKYNFESVVDVINNLEEGLNERSIGVLSMARNHVLKSLDKALEELA